MGEAWSAAPSHEDRRGAPQLSGRAYRLDYGGGSESSVARTLENAVLDLFAPDFIWPVEGRLTSRFRRRHSGIDIAVLYEPIAAAASGQVVFAGGRRCCGYGRYVEILHADGYLTRYAHLSSFLVKPGDRVEQGNVIGISGDTGRSTGPHLHFEVWRDDVAANPLLYLPQEDRRGTPSATRGLTPRISSMIES